MKNSIRVYHWSARILAMIAIFFISIFALDAFSLKDNFFFQIGDFIMHLIPSFILLILLIYSWKRELSGGIIFMVLGLGLSPIVFSANYNMNHSFWMSIGIIMMITIPFFVVGLFFLISHFKKKNKKTPD